MSTHMAEATHPELAALAAMDLPIEEEAQAYEARYALAVARIALGWTFLWAFLDKAFGLGFATERADAWINGGSPTYGFLTSATEGKLLHDLFASLTGPVSDWLFMTGLLGIGVALTLGIGMRIAATSGALLLTFMWAAELPLENNPFLDDHIISAVVLVALAIFGADRTWGLGRTWEKVPLVQRVPLLR